MAGYSSRQSTFTTGDTITAAHSNNEFNAILAAFNVSTGHKHDGTTAGDGGPISTLFSNTISMGTGADTDIALTFNANSNDGVITWMEDQDYFQFSDDILISTTEKIQFRDTAIYINSSADGQLDIVADTEIQIAATTVDINGNVDISGSLTLGGTTITSTGAELNILDGVTSTAAELNILDGVTSTAAELNILDGVTSTTAELNILDGVTSTAAELNILDGVTSTAAELNILDGVTSTAAELNLLDGSTAGTVVASKAVVVDSDKDLTGIRNLTIAGDLTISGDDLTMATNTAGNLLIADGTNYNPTAVGDLSEISSVANDDVLLALDTSGGGLKKITRSTLVAGLTAGTEISNLVEDTTPQLGGDLDAQGKDITDVGILSADASAGIYGATGSPVVFTVTVASKTSAHPYNGDGSSSGYFLNGVESPALKLHGADSVTSSSGYYYKFDQADSSNSSHPLRFYLDAAKTIAYTTGVTTSGTPGTAGAHTTIAVTDQTPSTLYYQCSSHGYMGNYASVDSANITSSGAVTIDAVGDVTLDADGGDILFKDAGTTFGSATNTSGDLILKSGTTTALTFSGANATVAGNLVVTGNHTVNGTTTTVNSTTVTIDDPIFTLGGDGTPGSDDNKDRGIEFKYHTGSAAKVGFFGWDDSAGAFTFVPDATNSSEVFSGSVGNAIFGNVTGTLQTAAQTNITSVGALDGGSITSNFGTIDTGASAITTTGLISGGSLDIDNVLINGTTIGHTDDTDLLTLANGALTVAGTIEGTTITASTAVVPDASGGADLGSTSLEWGDLYIADDKKIYLGSDQNFSIEYDEDGNDTTAVVAAGGVSLAPHGTSTGNGTELRFQELAANGANYVGFKSPDAIASNEVWVLPNADGSDGQVLKTDGSNALSWGEAGGGGTIDMVADGDIAIRKPVVLTAAGKAKEVAFSDAAAGVGTALTLDSSVNGSDNRTNLIYMDGVGSGVKTFVKIFCDGGTSNHITAIAFTISDTGARTVTAGTPVVVTSNDTSYMDAVFDPDTDRVIMVYRNGDDADKPYYSVISVSGTTLTSSTVAVVIDDANLDPQDIALSYDTTADRIALVFQDNNFSASERSKIRSYVGTVTGGTTNSVAWGSNVHADTDIDKSNSRTRICYDAGTNRHLLIYKDSDGLQSRVGTLTGASTNTLAWGNQTTLHTAFAQYDVAVTYEATQAKCVVSFSNGSTTQSLGVVTVTGSSTNTAAIGSLVTISRDDAAGAPNSNAISAIAASKVGYVYNVSNTVKVTPFTISGTSLSAGTAVTIASADTSNTQIAGVVATGAAAVSFETTNTSISAVEFRSATISGGGTTSLTKDNYLGISKAAISDGATGKIVIPGGISEGHSSLTIDSNIFTNGAGDIGLAGDSGGLQFLGRAVSATQIQLRQEEFSHYAEAGETLTAGQLIEINSSGNVIPIIGNATTFNKTTQYGASGDRTADVHAAYDPDTERVVVAYADKTNSNYLTTVVGTITGGTTNSASWGTPQVVQSYNSDHSERHIYLVYDESVNRMVLLFGRNDSGYSSFRGGSVVGTVTGGTTNSISWGTSALIDGDTRRPNNMSADYDDADNRIYVGYECENTVGSTVSARFGAGKVTGGTTNTIAWGTFTDLNGGNSNISGINVVNDETENKTVIIYRDEATSNYLTLVKNTTGGTDSSPSVSLSGETRIGSNQAVQYTSMVTSCYVGGVVNKVVTAFQKSSKLYIQLTSGSSSYGSPFEIVAQNDAGIGTNYPGAIYPHNITWLKGSATTDANGVSIEKVLVVFADQANQQWGIEVNCDADANALAHGTPVKVGAYVNNSISSTNTIYDDASSRAVVISKDSTDQGGVYDLTLTYVAEPQVDSTKANVDGFAGYATTSGNAVGVALEAGIDNNQSGLTTGSLHYIDDNGLLTTTSTSNQKIGKALSATKIQVITS